MIKYFKKHFKFFMVIFLIFLSFNFYFIFLLSNINIEYLIYLDILLIVFMMMFFCYDLFIFKTHEKEKMEYLQSNDYISTEIKNLEDSDIIEHNFQIFQQNLNEQLEVNHDLQDFIMKWCHEIKLPLSAALLMNEKIEDPNLRLQLKEQLEKIKQYLNSALVSCKVQGTFHNLHIERVLLKECIHTSIKNNRYFLIKNKVDLELNLDDFYVYTDKEFMVYIIDQLITNAIKYAKEKPKIQIQAQQQDNAINLYIKDYGEGIKDYDLPRVFERGYIGSNHHNGKYKSTGMGLYMVMLMIKKLGHQISVRSVYQEFTCFCITFKNIEKHFNL